MKPSDHQVTLILAFVDHVPYYSGIPSPVLWSWNTMAMLCRVMHWPMIYKPIKIHWFYFHWSVAWGVAWTVAWDVTIPEVQRYCSYEEPDETPNWGTQFGSWLPHVMWYFVTQQMGCKWVFVWTLQQSMKFQTLDDATCTNRYKKMEWLSTQQWEWGLLKCQIRAPNMPSDDIGGRSCCQSWPHYILL